ncbi:16S rRNA (cytosine(1402)-N(4))-methyltransferase [Candidatus Wolfebacteria bacterium RIFCSPLOWO2_01_FULL_38_11]|uniref:Ribosomal RNA small subunit methyltransferase H n=2 Tax=Candidatus Wolfeibacteriota TaxID=1752735 RepID=A0A0G0FUT0_9BACT|nr:MAG: Ribosomal RNA small subunit methyltransferase H [Candidatus Wolfebacteria bacterium GW2011_GWC1_37_10]OGM90838.1 MAG: 16S rRNA (cytosine(1402)-N(4))-methyltransferase [Candidatus Wolfebacteria bacterium RIFCSPLOWO2_01_FULL_38_11]
MTHIPVLLKEVIEILNPKEGEFFIDGTLGAGGHAKEILKKIGSGGGFLGVDWDKEAIRKLKAEDFKNHRNAIFVQGNYAGLPEILKKNNLPKADGLIIDLGFSSDQLEILGRGFSFLRDEILDMRYDVDSENLTAAELINSFSEKDLADIFFKYGEERFSRQIAKKIVEQRKKKRILTTFDLSAAIEGAVPRNYERGRIPRSRSFASLRGRHPSTRIFQALRIYVNDELGNLKKFLENLEKVANSKGRVAIISFHSLEDRLVKNHFNELVKRNKAEFLIKKFIRASEEETRNNPRSRSAKLRAIQLAG